MHKIPLRRIYPEDTDYLYNTTTTVHNPHSLSIDRHTWKYTVNNV